MINVLKTLPEIVRHYIKENGFTLLLLIVAIFFVGLSTDWGRGDICSIFTKFWDPWLGIAGILFTLGLTIYYARSQWIESLDKKLIVHFVNTKGHYLASCYNVNVLPNAELRALGLQVGQQMFGIQNLKFNPSITETGREQIIRIKNKEGKTLWIQYYEITFNLLEDSYNHQSKFYTVWNISRDRSIKKRIDVSDQPYHKWKTEDILLLLSEDKKSIEQFDTIAEIKFDHKMYLLNSAIVTAQGTYLYETLLPDDAHRLIQTTSFISAIGHESTADILSKKTGLNIPANRIAINMQAGDQAIVFKIKSRMEEGKVYTRDELSGLVMEYGLLTRQN
jgi:hypothetical protein